MQKLERPASLGRTESWLRLLGFGVWAFVGLSHLHGRPRGMQSMPWIVPWLLYAIAFLLSAVHARFSRWLSVALLMVQSMAVLMLPWLGLPGFEGLLLSSVAAQAPTILPIRQAALFAAVQAIPLFVTVFPLKNARELGEILGAYSTFTAFALLVYRLQLRERAARDELAQANADLVATRALLVEGSRQGERLRISRELHDSLGHHLAALSLHLEIAHQVSEGRATAPIERAREISKESLGEVRRVVGEMQSPWALDLVETLRALAAGIPMPRISVEAKGDVSIDSAAVSHALFRCVQEAITNSIKHASAENVRIEISRGPEGLDVRVTDDGRGVRTVAMGRGLSGIAARAAEVGGRARFESAQGRGFSVHLSVPTGGSMEDASEAPAVTIPLCMSKGRPT